MVKHSFLGASEFAATLNGDDPTAILRVLKQFTKTVQRERRFALSEDDGDDSSDDDSSSDDEEEEIEQPPQKKFKKDEQWKEDSASYHVPFVGTSVAKSDVANVVRGQWPTGLLQAYLEKSPLAIELTSDDLDAPDGQIHKSLTRRKKYRMSRAIQKAYIRALAELVTAAIPLERLGDIGSSSVDGKDTNMRRDETPQVVMDKFLAPLLKKRLNGIFKLLNEETGRGRGKIGVFGGCGDLAAPALKLIQNIALVSVTYARRVSQNLDEALNDGVLRCLLKPLPQRREKENSTESKDINPHRSKEARTEAINLVTTLIRKRDSVVNTYICTSGSKERKVKPGILFVALREGLLFKHQESISTTELDEDYLDAIADMMYSFRILVVNQPRLVNKKLLLNLLSREPLQNLCQLLSYAPSLNGDNSIQSVLEAKDFYQDLESLPNAAVEARRLLFPVLSEPSKSPFLSSFGNIQDSIDEVQLVRTMISLRQIPNAGITMQHFLLDCTRKTPRLLSGFFRMLAFPDHKKVFDFISWCKLVSSLMRLGPSPIKCLSHTQRYTKTKNIDDILVSIFPIKFKRQTLAKSIQSGNPLIVFECLKLIRVALERFRLLRSRSSEELGWSNEFNSSLSSAFAQCLPDLQILLTIRNKFDAFSTNKANIMINHCLNRVLDFFSDVFPSLIDEAKFDWIKLIPGTSSQFLNSSPLIQKSVLYTLSLVFEKSESSSSSTVNVCKTLLEVMLQTRSKEVHHKCKQIVKKLLIRLFKSRWVGTDSFASVENECQCWMDGLTLESLPSFCKRLQNVSEKSLGLIADIGKAWEQCHHFGAIEFSLLLVDSLNSTDESPSFSRLVAQVCMKSLLFHRNPLALATLIQFLYEKISGASLIKANVNRHLVNYANSLHLSATEDQVNMLGTTLKAYFSAQDIFVITYNWCIDESRLDADDMIDTLQLSRGEKGRFLPFVRFLNHAQVIFSPSNNALHKCQNLLSRTVPDILLQLNSESQKSKLLEDISSSRGGDKVFELIVMSFPEALELEFATSRIKKFISCLSSGEANKKGKPWLNEDQRMVLFQCLLLGDSIPMNSVVKLHLALISNLGSGSQDSLNLPIDIIVVFMKSTCSRLESDIDYEPDVLRELFDAWWLLSNEAKLTSNPNLMEIRSHLNCVMSVILASGNTQSSILMIIINEKIGKDVIERSLIAAGNEALRDEKYADEEAKFLTLVLKYNFVRMAPDFLKVFKQMTPKLKVAWESGFLYDSLSYIIQNHDKLKSVEEAFEDIFSIILTRATLLLSKGDRVKDLLDIESAVKITYPLFDTPKSLITIKVPDGFFKGLSMRIKSQGLKQNPAAKRLCQLAVLLLQKCDSKFGEMDYFDNERKCLASTLLLRLFEWLPILLKGQEHTGIREVLTWLMILITDVKEYDLVIIRSSKPQLVQKVFRSILKYGIDLSEKDPELASLAMKFLHSLLSGLTDPNSPLGTLRDDLLVIQLADVFKMLTTHSKFSFLLSSEDNKNDCVKLEFVRLLLCCLARADKGIVIEGKIWITLFGAFDAGLSELDTAIRKLFYACCDLLEKSNDVYIPFLDEFRWKSISEDGPQGNSRWDWLLEALDPNRIRATISHFPLYDTVKVDFGMIDNNLSKLYNDGQSSIDHSESDDDTSTDDESADSASIDIQVSSGNGLLPGLVWNEYGPDIRYSPAFLLPFILGALESRLPHSTEKDTMDSDIQDPKRDNSSQSNYELFVLMAKRLCDKGALGLCLASLSSRCDKIRCYAVSIMGILLQACHSDEARALSSWRGRPQLEMLLNSTQRALAIKKASGSKSGQQLQVPILSPLVSSFLARTSLSVCQPDDALFVPLNRYFLKNEENHGAFRDMNRIPAFVSLFCSASDDQNQARKERMWALQLIRDGYLDASCYQLLTSCHAPELILSAFENVRLSQVSDEMKDAEYTLMFDVFVKLVKFGSNHVVSHLLSRLGLLSWMRSWCLSGQFLQTFPGSKSKISFCSLVSCVVQRTEVNKRLRTDILVHEVCGLVEPIILLGTTSNRAEESFGPLLSTICETLGCLTKIIFDLRKEGIMSLDLQPLGLPLDSSIEFLKLVDISLRDKAIHSLSCLPLRLDGTTVDNARSFCSHLLHHCLDTDTADEERVKMQSSIVPRVKLVVTHFCDSLSSDSGLFKMLLAIRPNCVHSEIDYMIWDECLQLFLANKSCCGDEVEVVRECRNNHT